MTTEELVKEILEVSEEVTSLTPFITAAVVMVAKRCSGISAADAEIVETWLAAHFACIRDTRVSSEAVSGVSQSFQHRVEVGLGVTMYGQMAMQLDPTGGLARWNTAVVKGLAGKTASMSWLGRTTTTEDIG